PPRPPSHLAGAGSRRWAAGGRPPVPNSWVGRLRAGSAGAASPCVDLGSAPLRCPYWGDDQPGRWPGAEVLGTGGPIARSAPSLLSDRNAAGVAPPVPSALPCKDEKRAKRASPASAGGGGAPLGIGQAPAQPDVFGANGGEVLPPE